MGDRHGWGEGAQSVGSLSERRTVRSYFARVAWSLWKIISRYSRFLPGAQPLLTQATKLFVPGHRVISVPAPSSARVMALAPAPEINARFAPCSKASSAP